MTSIQLTDEQVASLCPAIAGGRYVIVRSERAGVFAGMLVAKEGNEVTLHQARRLWQWAGAASLSQLAQSGTSNPKGCKFPEPVDEVILLGVIEILTVTRAARALIESVPVWRA